LYRSLDTNNDVLKLVYIYISEYPKKERGGYLVKPKTDYSLSYHIQHSQDIGKRSEQQDALGKVQTAFGTLLILADGMGGMSRGGFFSSRIVEILSEKFQHIFTLSPSECLISLYRTAQEEIVRHQHEENEGGSTLVLALLQQANLWFLSIGDSRLYLARGGGIIQLTRDQVLGKLLEERAALGFLPMQDALENQCRASLDNFVGVSNPRLPDISHSPIHLIAGDCIALMSDGVFRALGDCEIASLLSQVSSHMASDVIRHVKQKKLPSQDNSSIILAIAQREK